MIILLSPAKTQDFSPIKLAVKATKPQALADIKILINELKTYEPAQLVNLMKISNSLANLNYERFKNFNVDRFDQSNAKPAIFAYQGDAYQSLEADTFTDSELQFMQNHLIILSGLYGYLRPLDLIQPYRLEMKTLLKNPRGKDLYKFWQDKITSGVNKALSKHKNKIVLNLASDVYFKAIDPNKLDGKLVTIQFKEKQLETYKTIGIYAKQARGMMTRFIIQNELDDIKKIPEFDEAKYKYSAKLSSEDKLVFTRKQ